MENSERRPAIRLSPDDDDDGDDYDDDDGGDDDDRDVQFLISGELL